MTRLALADERRAVRRVLDDPALVELEGGLEDRLFVLGQEIEVLHAALGQRDRGPDFLVVHAALGEQLLQVPVAHGEAAGQRLLQEDVGRDRLDPGLELPAMMRDRGGRRDRHLVGEALHDAVVRGVRARAALLGELAATPRRPGARMCLNIRLFHTLAMTLSNGTPLRLQEASGSPSRRARPSARASPA